MLIIKARQQGCTYMMKKIEENMNLVYFIIHKYYPTFINDEDIVQSGMLGLCKAVNTFDESKSTFSTYASTCIRNEIAKEFTARKKHKGVLSLEYETQTNDGDRTVFGDTIVGDEDVGYIDVDEVCKDLTPVEQETFRLRKSGMTINEISNHFGCKKDTVWKRLRKVRALMGGNE